MAKMKEVWCVCVWGTKALAMFGEMCLLAAPKEQLAYGAQVFYL